ncbi:AAA family ATPase [Kocuria sabuli]|uniref:AAA family ATPase n=1 Tax=Kocuria sabuli TaxID=3071448 RepID=UPI0034D74780
MDRPWDGAVCNDPKGNSSCVLLKNIGPKRDDNFEQLHAGIPIAQLDAKQLPPCLIERSTFMSASGYRVVKTHPYAHNKAISVVPSPVSVPAYAFESVPFRWMSRKSLADEIGYDRVPGFRPEAEDAADVALKWDASQWVMDGANQKAILKAFFESVTPQNSLVFMYLKHSPLQEQRTNRLLVGAAHVTDVQLPPMWNSDGPSAFTSSMWETIVSHSLREDQQAGMLLPYQDLATLQESGIDVSEALAWAPEGRDVEFSYVTEHLSDDAALQALASLQAAAKAMPSLGLEVPVSAMEWLDTQIARLWNLRGPTPGLAAVLSHLRIERPHTAARELLAAAGGGDVWQFLETGFADPSTFPPLVQPLIGKTAARVWSKRTKTAKDVLRVLSGMDISAAQVELLLDGPLEVPVTAEEIVDNPYRVSVCTYGQADHVPFSTVDRACYPGEGALWKPLVPQIADFNDHQDERRVEALLVEVLEAAGERGDTLLTQEEALQAASDYALERPPQLTAETLEALELDSASLRSDDAWPIVGVEVEGGEPALKLFRFDFISETIRFKIAELRNRPRFKPVSDLKGRIDAVLPEYRGGDEAEDRAREEKTAGLAELHASPLSVLIGPAGTGKTTLLKALVGLVGPDRCVLLAPTGKARVQLATKVGGRVRTATLASFLSRVDRFDGERYRVLDDHGPRIDADLVVIDEASMLTEEMLAAALDAFRSINRLVLVGDPRQLPPIGAGRPFVDLVNVLHPHTFEAKPRVGPSYVELRVPRRQQDSDEQITVADRRADLELAAWFGDGDLGLEADQIWHNLATNPDQETIRYVPWGNRPIEQVLTDELTAELDLADVEGVRGVKSREAAFALTYGGTLNDGWLNWDLGAGKNSENWQILSPTRSRMSGTTEINRHIKRTYRGSELELAQRNNWKGTNIPAPIGPEQIVRGDKVMATQNDSRAKSWPSGSGLNYVANGEIGVGIGRRRTGKKKSLQLNVEYSSQPEAQYSYWATDGEDAKLELAWAVTVHKSQGSEFAKTFLVLPTRANVSRELMYTALTRQRQRVVILHEGTLADLRELTYPWRSETARRLTDLFAAPKPVSGDWGEQGRPRRFDGRVMHVTAGGEVVKSKNEVIVANVLDEVAPGRWAYEAPLKGIDGRTIHPDFTIQRPDGSFVLWEHLGLMDDVDYARKWGLKKEWYAANGFLPHPQRGEHGTLMWTNDMGGVDVPAWRQLALDVIGTPISRPSRRGPAAGRRRPRAT